MENHEFYIPSDVNLDDLIIWVVNEYGELGIKIGNRIGYLYKGEFIDYAKHRGTEKPPKWRRVYKREFGEVCHGFEWWDRKTGLLSEWAKDFKNSATDENPWRDQPV